MIHPWQVRSTDVDPVTDHDQDDVRSVLIVSSPLHLRLNLGLQVTVVPVTSTFRDLRYRIPIESPIGKLYVITDQVQTIPAARLTENGPEWTLSGTEIYNVRRALRLMLDL